MSNQAFNTKHELLSEDIIKKNILIKYKLTTPFITEIKFKDTDKQRAVYKVINNNCSFCLKKVYYNEAELCFIYSVIEWLYRYNIKVARILPTQNGERFVEYNHMLFILTPWLEGSKCNYDILAQVLSSAKNLALMHKYTKHFFPIEGSSIRRGFDNIYASTNRHFNELLNLSNLACKYDDEFSNIFIANFDNCIKLAQNSLSYSSNINSNNLSKAICHLDYVNKNIIIDKKSNIWVIDFDKCKLDYCAHDLSYFFRRILKRDSTNWNIELFKNCIRQYETIESLTKDDYNYILSYLSFPQKYWKISKDYFNNINNCNSADYVFLLKKAVKNVDSQLKFSMELNATLS